MCFNPHARVGRDLRLWLLCRLLGVSIHTPVWGVTDFASVNWGWKAVSIHTPVWGVTHLFHSRSAAVLVSIHTPVWGVTS